MRSAISAIAHEEEVVGDANPSIDCSVDKVCAVESSERTYVRRYSGELPKEKCRRRKEHGPM
jgi:hypothetical protein